MNSDRDTSSSVNSISPDSFSSANCLSSVSADTSNSRRVNLVNG